MQDAEQDGRQNRGQNPGQDAGQDADDRHGDDQTSGDPRGRFARLLGRRPLPRRLFGEQPLSVYGVLLAGVAVLAVLLAIIWATGRGDGPAAKPDCLTTTPEEALAAIDDGAVAGMRVLTEQGRPERGPLLVTLDLNNGNCRRLPEGVAAQPELYQIIGYATVFNQSRAGEQRIGFDFSEESDIPASSLATATPTPTVTPIPTNTPDPTPAPTTTAAPATGTPPPTATVAPTATPVPAPPLVPAASPPGAAASPLAPPVAPATPDLGAPPPPTVPPPTPPTPPTLNPTVPSL